MADIFLTNRGLVTAIDGPGTPMSLFIDNWEGFFGFKSIITGFSVKARGGVQFLHTLRDFIYLYVFGERISEMAIRGVSFWDDCDAPSFHGVEYVNAYYLDNRVSELADPITVILGLGTPFFGFLTSFDFEFRDPEQVLAEFTLGLHVIPEASLL